MKIQVKGHSGCRIEIVNDGSNLYICKSTQDPKYVDRLSLQAQKQRDAARKEYRNIHIPEIYAVERQPDQLAIRMEYVYSKNYIDYFEDAGFDDICSFVKALQSFVNDEIADSPLQAVDTSVVKEKFADVFRKCQNNSALISQWGGVEPLLQKCGEIFGRLPGEIEIPLGKCHGDLTFSNILFNGNSFYLIDFLDSFIESPLMDLVKIRQDSRFEWSRLMYEGDVDLVRLHIISEKIDSEIDGFYSQYGWYREYYSVFQLMNFLRILQYAKEEKVINYLMNVIGSMI